MTVKAAKSAKRKGKQIRERTPEEQAIYDEVIVELLNGGNAREISRRTGISWSKLRTWRMRARKQIEKESKIKELRIGYQRGYESVTGDSHSVTASEIETESNRHVESSVSQVLTPGKVRESVASRLGVATALLDGVRDGVSEALLTAHNSLESLIKQVKSTLDAGVTTKICIVDGEVAQTSVPLSVSDYKALSATLKDAIQKLADLHCLPHGSIKLDKSLIPQQNSPQQHLHYHSHGGDGTLPIAQTETGRTKVIEHALVTDVTDIKHDAIEIKVSNAEKLDDNQRRLVEDL